MKSETLKNRLLAGLVTLGFVSVSAAQYPGYNGIWTAAAERVQ